MNQPPVDFIRVEADAHREFGASCLEACGLEDAQAEHIAARLTWADLRGIHSHGAPLLERYVRDLRAGTVNPAPSMHVVREEDAMIVVDGDGGYGYVPTASVTEKIIGKARDRGVAAGSLLHIGHYGSASHYTSMCAEEGCIGFSVPGLVSGFDFRSPQEEARRYVPTLTGIRDDADGLPVVLRQYACDPVTAFGFEGNPLPDPELQHLPVYPLSAKELDARDNSVVQIGELPFGHLLQVDSHSIPSPKSSPVRLRSERRWPAPVGQRQIRKANIQQN